MPLDISIPSAQTADSSKPYTIYTVSIRQPLRTITHNKRYSDFEALHNTLIKQTNTPPPAPLPSKSWFSRTVNNPTLTETRRQGLEAYLQAIERADDARWRTTPAWRAFLDLPATAAAASSTSPVRTSLSGLGAQVVDPAGWLDVHRELKAQLHAARTALIRREQPGTAPAAQHEAGAAAKKSLVRAGTLIAALDEGLRRGAEGEGRSGWDAGERLGEGEIRRRRDMLGAARKEREGLESVLSSFVVKAVGSAQGASSAAAEKDKEGLFQGSGGRNGGVGVGRRVLGAPLKETERTRELDNEGVLQLQRQIMHEQDQDVTVLTDSVRRMKEMGIQINEELLLQGEMLDHVDNDMTRLVVLFEYPWGIGLTCDARLGDKINIAKKRVGRIK